MQDFNYLATNCFELTIEMGCNKFPTPDQLPEFWRENKHALIEYALQVSWLDACPSKRAVFSHRAVAGMGD